MKKLYDVTVHDVKKELELILHSLQEKEKEFESAIEAVQPHYRESARNLIHYLTLRTFDLRAIQRQLSTLGLSSVGHSESYTMANVENIVCWLRLLTGETDQADTFQSLNRRLPLALSRDILYSHNTKLLGHCKRPNGIKIMVTMPTEASQDVELLEKLLLAGMNIARINCSHDDEEVWEKMIQNLQTAQRSTGQHCLVYMDLAGPKIRTGEIQSGKDNVSKKGPYILLQTGDQLELHRKKIKGREARRDPDGKVTKPARISVTLPRIIEDIEKGDPIFFDDGSIGGEVIGVNDKMALVRITNTPPEGRKLRADKGINLPQTDLKLPSLTKDDRNILTFICRYADMVGYSFVRKPEDVEDLQKKLHRLNRSDIGIVLKIETQEAFNNLSQLLLTAMRSPTVGVMIARGDLAVEVGFERIAEVQEELLWICEAAHIPVIWATQVLEKLAKTGIATRAEITDAAMSGRAECVMLNKGPFIVQAVSTLNDILERMSGHQRKRHGRLRPLNIARDFFRPVGENLEPEAGLSGPLRVEKI